MVDADAPKVRCGRHERAASPQAQRGMSSLGIVLTHVVLYI
jgi:hypothetical protein